MAAKMTFPYEYFLQLKLNLKFNEETTKMKLLI